MGRVRAGPARYAGLPRQLARELDRCVPLHKEAGEEIRQGRVTIYTDGAGWYVDACRWADVEHVVYDRPLRNPMERINRYLKDRTEAFDDLYPVRGRRSSFERILSWLSGYKFLHNYVLTNTGLGRAPLEWSPPPWLEGSGSGGILAG
ncbi:MAG: hypothetical protein ACP5NG_02705 [Conexivisphaera sp.]